MQVHIEAARALLYETSRICDQENNNLRILEWSKNLDKAEQKERKQTSRAMKRLNSMLTPMSKYYCSEMCISVANDTVQVLGGSGFITDYPAERYLRDARITTIYEGTSQLQVVAAVRGITSGTFGQYVAPFEEKQYDDSLLEELKRKLIAGREKIVETIAFVKGRSSSYVDLSARRLVDAAITVICGHLLLAQGAASERKRRVARRYVEKGLGTLEMNCREVLAGDVSAIDEYELLAGPVPVVD